MGIPQQKSEQEIASLTSIRGIAAFWVVLFHLADIAFGFHPESSFLRPLIGAGWFAVPLFFVLSGYVLGLRYLTKLRSPSLRTVLRFWWLRLGRIDPVHLFTLLVSLALVARHRWPTDAPHSPGRFVANLLLIQAWDYNFELSWNYPSWSISSEWFAYLIFPLVTLGIARMGRRWAPPLVVVLAALAAAAYAFEPYLAFKGLVVVAPTFVGGVVLSIVCPPGSATKRSIPWAELGLAAAIVLPFAIAPGPALNALYMVLFFALVGRMGAEGSRSSAFWKARPLVYLGDISYSLYMTHAITITLLTVFLPLDAMREKSVAVRSICLLGYIIIILLAAVAVYYAVERPLRDLSRRLAGLRSGPPLKHADDSTVIAVKSTI